MNETTKPRLTDALIYLAKNDRNGVRMLKLGGMKWADKRWQVGKKCEKWRAESGGFIRSSQVQLWALRNFIRLYFAPYVFKMRDNKLHVQLEEGPATYLWRLKYKTRNVHAMQKN